MVTRFYRPPEIIYGSQNYDQSVDIWSTGCVFAELFLGKPLFPGETDIDQLSKIFSVLGSPNEENWPGCTSLPNFLGFENSQAISFKAIIQGIPNNVTELISEMLNLDPKKRISTENALKSDIFKNIDLGNVKYDGLIKLVAQERNAKLNLV